MTLGIPAAMRREVVEVVKSHLDRKNILIHTFGPMDDSFLWDHNWNGAVRAVDHDYLMVVDSSLPGHSNAEARRSWDYRVSLDPERPMEARLRLRYENLEEAKDATCLQYAWELYPCYWNYFRVYVSPMSTGIQMPPVPIHEGSLKLVWGYPDVNSARVVTESDTGPARLTELAGYLAVEPGSVVTVPIRYRLPKEILRSTAPGVYEYRLLVQKQPAMDRDRVSIAVELPANVERVQTSPEYNSIRGRWYLFDFTLERDTTVIVSFRMNQQAS